MRIVACIKQVPAEADLRMDEERWTLVRTGVPSLVNPHDLQALELALMLRDLHGGEVLALTMGPPQSEEALREALAMGADQGILLTDPALAGADTLATSAVLAQTMRRLPVPPDVILCGTRTTDSDTGQVGPQVAEDLGIPHVAYVEDVEVEGQNLMVRRRVDRYRETLRVRVPVLLTVLRAPSRPRSIPFLFVEEAFRTKQVLHWGIADLGLEPNRAGFAGSATRVREIREPMETRQTRLVNGNPLEAVQAIMQAFMERHILE